MIKKYIKELAFKVFSVLGFAVMRKDTIRPIDFRKQSLVSPRILYYTGHHQPIIIEAPIKNGRSHWFFGLHLDSSHPQLFALKKAIKTDCPQQFEHVFCKHQKHFNELYKPKNAREALGLSKEPSVTNNFPYWCLVLPWWNQTMQNKYYTFPKLAKRNRLEHGFQIKNEDPEQIMKESFEHGVFSHSKQYYKLYRSISKEGYKRSDKPGGDINVEILLWDHEWRWRVSGSGNHRAVVVAALGWNTVPVRVTRIIRREDADFWPNVVNGIFTKKQAFEIFDNIFFSSPPEIYSHWENYVKSFEKKN